MKENNNRVLDLYNRDVSIQNTVFSSKNTNVIQIDSTQLSSDISQPIKYLPDSITRKLIRIHAHIKILDSHVFHFLSRNTHAK